MRKPTISLDSVVVRTKDLVTTGLQRELIILNIQRDSYVALDEIGNRIWELLAAEQKVLDLCIQVGKEFQGEPRQIEDDLLRFLSELQAEALVDVVKA